MNTSRSKWTAVTAAAVIAATVGGFGLVQAAPGSANLLTAIDPCRLVDSRSASNVGPLAARLGPAQTATFTATGDNGDCVGIPADVQVVEIQLTSVGATADTFWTAYPSDLATRPTVSQLNPRVALATTSNSTIVTLSPTGEFSLYNASGSSDVVIDILAYFSPGAGGPAGPAGPQGATGAQGDPGVQGAIGDPGPTGAQGDVGSDGAAGAQGDAGSDGADGAQGDAGAPGADGAQGDAGAPGADGATGAQGDAGSDGATGVQGPQGDAGSDGSDGAAGVQGPQGDVGSDGAAGVQGPQGDVGSDGATGPQGDVGSDGATGAPGSDGATGPQGDAGSDGATGPQGDPGTAGAQGPQGVPGLAGVEIVTGALSPSNTFAKTATATCPSGKIAIGGGHNIGGAGAPTAITQSSPTSSTVWTVRTTITDRFVSPGSYTLTAIVICATVAP